jgi:hypothetical protein
VILVVCAGLLIAFAAAFAVIAPVLYLVVLGAVFFGALSVFGQFTK